ncbi:hypothetical protein [Halothece sp. PCC 7418]|uniref:hypothetical protein n=1 Tax=Halothece sp. (strain PCC 7418) TaxID=65093 RepID=UPI00031503DD|nr:hypothetical protein [Halothece sp. PCC 7418]
MVSESKLERLTKQIARARHSLEELAFQERDLREKLEVFNFEAPRDDSYWRIRLGLSSHRYWDNKSERDRASSC